MVRMNPIEWHLHSGRGRTASSSFFKAVFFHGRFSFRGAGIKTGCAARPSKTPCGEHCNDKNVLLRFSSIHILVSLPKWAWDSWSPCLLSRIFSQITPLFFVFAEIDKLHPYFLGFGNADAYLLVISTTRAGSIKNN